MALFHIDGEKMLSLFEQAYLQLNNEKELINGLNVFPVPDGDTGTNMSLTFKSAIDVAKKAETTHPYNVAKAVAKGSLMGARGNSGVILSQILGGLAKGMENIEVLTPHAFADALHSAAEKSYKAVIKPVEGTILTVIRLTAEKLSALDFEAMDFENFFDKVLEYAKEALDETPNLLAILKESGVVDAGGRGLLSVFQGFDRAIKGNLIEDIDFEQPTESIDHIYFHQKPAEIKFQYCTEFILGDVHGDIDSLKHRIESLGDSMVFVEDEGIIKSHIHTNHPGEALEAALMHGQLISIKIENMKEQHNTILAQDEHVQEKKQEREIGVIAVASGEGFKSIFKDFGVDEVVLGGQTMNPSTEDLAEAARRINAKKLIVLPNNSNIVMAANQLKDILEETEVEIIESKTIPQGITAMMSFNRDEGFSEMVEAMKEQLNAVSTLQITTSVRNTKLNGFAIKEHDALAIMNGTIVAVEKTTEKALKKAIGFYVHDYELITIYTGEQTDLKKTERLASDIMKKEEVDIEVYEGGQPVYDYIVSFE